ncbi:FKBP-type peptidyl-prolyl cis-trans isomerase N-terminal domain-containing protein [Haloferula sp.]|uniref:FKBP-type peptidyl-prolyl cis-trans isomerase N-terminal domain-containing protein n=1 Tax=Haloferula sp. TaxID=2497595 RepID=UPI0032A08BEA
MKSQIIPGALALGLAVSFTAAAEEKAAEEKPKAVSPPVQVPASPAGAKAVSPPVQVPPPAAPPMDPAQMKTESSYGLGYRTGGEFGQRWGNFGITPGDIDNEKFLAGFLAGFKGGEPEIDAEKLGAAMQALGNALQAREKELGAKNLEAGKAFLEENGKKEGIVTTDSGLQYKILDKGGDTKYVAPKEGEPAKQFMVNYKGTLIDGTEFDASPEGQPVPMTLQVVDGFKEAITTMPVGAKWQLFVPGKLAYGEQRRSADIGPNQTLIFELELVEIKDAPAPQHPGGMPFPMPQPGQGQ